MMESTLQQRLIQYERQAPDASMECVPNATIADNMGNIREVIRSVVREELQNLGVQTSTNQFALPAPTSRFQLV